MLIEFLYSEDAAKLLGPEAKTVERMKERDEQDAPERLGDQIGCC